MTEAQEKPKPSNVRVLNQYIKDLSFESPNPPGNYPVQPELKINVNVNTRHLGDNDHEVSLQLEGAFRVGETKTIFQFDLTYSGVVRLDNVPPELVQGAIMVTTPALLFPFARQVLAQVVSNAGYPPLLVDYIDFGSLLARSQKAETPPASGTDVKLVQEAPTTLQ